MFKNCCGCQNAAKQKKHKQQEEGGGGGGEVTADGKKKPPPRTVETVKKSRNLPSVTVTEPSQSDVVSDSCPSPVAEEERPAVAPAAAPAAPAPVPVDVPEPVPVEVPEPVPEPVSAQVPEINTPQITIQVSDTDGAGDAAGPTKNDHKKQRPPPLVVESAEGTPTEAAAAAAAAAKVKVEIPDDVARDLLATGAILSGCEIIPRGASATPHPAKRGASLSAAPQWLSQDEDDVFEEGGGTQEPPATPVGRDELALRRHRFFSDLLLASQVGAEHRVRFDPLGPTVAGGLDCDQSPSVLKLEGLLDRLEIVTARLEETTSGVHCSHSFCASDNEISGSATRPASEDNMSVAAYNDIVTGAVASFVQLSQGIGGDVAAHAQLVDKVFKLQQQFIVTASQSRAPSSQSELTSLLQPTASQIQTIQEFREKHRGSPFFNHLSAVSESVPALGWVAVSPTPGPYVKEMNDAGQFYTNRVLKDFKEKDKAHVAWVKAWVQTLTELQQFVKQHHTTGLVWGGKGNPGPPPPPPGGMPPPPPVLPPDLCSGDDDTKDRSALFAEINRGEGITSSLKKVTSEMQTHKNPGLRSGPAPFKAQSQSVSSVSAPKSVEKPPLFVKEGKKWLVEHHKGNHSLLIEGPEMNNMVYMFKCQDSTLTIKGKLNAVILDSCKKTSVVFDTLVASVEFVNCQSVQMQVLDKVPTISIDKTDGCQMYLSAKSLDVEIVSSKSSEMNVMVPKGDGDFTEYPIPEQFKTTVGPKGLTTVAVDSLN